MDIEIRLRRNGKVWVLRKRRRAEIHRDRVIDLAAYRRRREAELLKRRRGPQGVA